MTPMTATPAVLLAAEGEPNPLVPHLSELIVGIIAFGLLYVFLSRKVFPIFERTFAERTAAIEGGIVRAQAAQAEAQAALEQYRAQLADARGEAASIRAEAQSERKGIVEQARVEAAEEASRVLDRGRAQMQADILSARAELSREVGRISVDLASKVVGENLADTDRTRATVDRFIGDLEATDAAPTGGRP